MRLLIIWLLVSAGAFVHANSVTLDNRTSYAVGSKFQWLSTEQSLDIGQVYNNPELNWQSFKAGSTSLGIIRNEHWLRVTLVNQTQFDAWLFQFDSNHLRYMDVWLFYSDGRREQRHLGAHLAVNNDREYWGPELNLSLQLNPFQQVDMYIRTQHLGQFDAAAQVLPLQQGLANNARKLSANLLFYGVLLTLMVYHLMLFIGVQDRTYLFYSIYLAATLFFLAFIEGFMYLIFDQSIHITHPVSQTSLIWMGLTSLWFANCFLSFTHRNGWIKQLYWALTFIGVLWVVARPALTSDIFIIGAMLLLLVSCIFIFFSSWLLGLKEHLDDARVMLLVWSVWLGWVSYLVLGAFNLFPFSLAENWWTFKLLFIAQFFALAWILTLRIGEQRQKKDIAEIQSNAKTELLSRVSHEMRTPLNGILGVSSMLMQHVSSKEGVELNKIIQSCGHSLLAVVNDLIEVSKLNQNQFGQFEAETELRPFIEEIWSFFKAQIEGKNLEPVLFLESDLPQLILLDQEHIEQIVTNLLSNAIKFTTAGRVELRVAYEHGELLLTVLDTGAGIERQFQEFIFEPFEQLHESGLKCRTGTGLGLSITKSLVERMGGRISVESELGKGSRFCVSIPAKTLQASENVNLVENANSKQGSLVVLVAEDNQVNLIVLQGILKKLGHTTLHCDNGKLTFDYYTKFHRVIDVVLMDCEMPIMDGYEATRLIREFERKRQIPEKPIIAVTAHVFDEHIDKIKACGMNFQINKPVSEEELSGTLMPYAVNKIN